jgi:hypothetical protein
MLTSLVGVVLIVLSIAMLRVAKRYELKGNRFFIIAARSTWLPLLFTAMFGLGVAAAIGGVFEFLAA